MQVLTLYRRLRKSGLRPDRSAALLGYALLSQQADWEDLKITRRHMRKIVKAFHKCGVDPECVDLLPFLERGRVKKGVIRSGGL